MNKLFELIEKYENILNKRYDQKKVLILLSENDKKELRKIKNEIDNLVYNK